MGSKGTGGMTQRVYELAFVVALNPLQPQPGLVREASGAGGGGDDAHVTPQRLHLNESLSATLEWYLVEGKPPSRLVSPSSFFCSGLASTQQVNLAGQ